MDTGNYTYFLILILSISAPIALSFDKRVQFYRKLKHVLPAIICTAIVFLFCDVWFTSTNVWSFNPHYIVGMYILDMPIEEWLFFLFIPYCCMFIYEVLKFYLKAYEFASFFRIISIILVVAFTVVSVNFYKQTYTLVTFSCSAVYLGYVIYRKNFNNHIEVADFGQYLVWVNNENISWAKGIEFEGKKDIAKWLEFRANVTLVNSRSAFNTTYIRPGGDEVAGRDVDRQGDPG